MHVIVEVPVASDRRAARLAESIEADLPVEFAYVGPSRSAGAVCLLVTDPNDGCSCSFLESTAMPHDERWHFTPAAKELLIGIIEHLTAAVGEFVFRAPWLGTDFGEEVERRIFARALAEAVQTDQLSADDVYFVVPDR